MVDTLARSKRDAFRLVLAQAATVALVAVVWLLDSHAAAVSAFAGGILVVLSNLLFARNFFAPKGEWAGLMLVRMAWVLLLRWIVLFVGLWFLLVILKLAALPAVIGFCIAVVTWKVLVIASSS